MILNVVDHERYERCWHQPPRLVVVVVNAVDGCLVVDNNHDSCRVSPTSDTGEKEETGVVAVRDKGII